MAKERTEKSKYTSPTTGDYCTEAQYITELFLRREIQKNEGETPPYKFWNKEPWKKKFVIITVKVNKLLKKFSAKAIINTMDQNKWMYSPFVKSFEGKIQVEQDKIDRETKDVIEVKHKEDSKPMKGFKKQSKRSKFKDL